MNNLQLNKWTDVISDNIHKAYGRSKDLFSSARARAGDGVRQLELSVPAKNITRSLPKMEKRLKTVRLNARQNMRDVFSHITYDLSMMESTVIKLSGIYLLWKWYKNRNNSVRAMTHNAKYHIMEKPLTSVFIAVALGYTIGKWRR